MKKISIAIVLLLTGLITIIDVGLLLKGYEYTISATLFELASGTGCEKAANPVIPFAIGIIGGHLFWPNRRASDVTSNPQQKKLSKELDVP